MARPSKKSKPPELESDARTALRFLSRPYLGSLRWEENLTNRTGHSIAVYRHTEVIETRSRTVSGLVASFPSDCEWTGNSHLMRKGSLADKD
jgi:hypothetical protein